MAGDFADVIVLIPGIAGSVLERLGREIWGTSAAAVLRGLLSGGRTIQDLLLENDDPEADDIGDGVQATRLVNDVHLFPGLWRIDGYTKVARRLCDQMGLEPQVNYFELPYDWRRDNRVAARKLQRESAVWLARRRQSYPAAKLILIAHSMGGLVSRYFLEVLEGSKDCRALITFGTPYRGSVNAIETLVNGVRKLGMLDLTDLSRSLTSIYQLLPIYACLDGGDGALARLSGTEEIPGLDRAHHDRIRQADRFHREIEEAVKRNQASVDAGTTRYAIHPIVGIDQPTSQSAIRAGNRVQLLRARGGVDNSGDGTVPRIAATPIETGESSAAFMSLRHGSLQNGDAVLDHLHGILTKPDLDNVRAVRRPKIAVSLDIDDIYASKEPLRFAACPREEGVPLEALIESVESSALRQVVSLEPSDGDPWVRRELKPLPAGVYRITVQGDPSQVDPFQVETVTEIFAVA